MPRAKIANPLESLRARLEMGQHRDLATGCHNWKKACDPKGYPRIRFKEDILYAIRAVLLVYRQIPLEKKLRCVSTCKNRKCINPEHFDIQEA